MLVMLRNLPVLWEAFHYIVEIFMVLLKGLCLKPLPSLFELLFQLPCERKMLILAYSKVALTQSLEWLPAAEEERDLTMDALWVMSQTQTFRALLAISLLPWVLPLGRPCDRTGVHWGKYKHHLLFFIIYLYFFYGVDKIGVRRGCEQF